MCQIGSLHMAMHGSNGFCSVAVILVTLPWLEFGVVRGHKQDLSATGFGERRMQHVGAGYIFVLGRGHAVASLRKAP